MEDLFWTISFFPYFCSTFMITKAGRCPHGMKRFLGIAIGLAITLQAIAQIPYYAGTVGDGRLYGYTSVKCRPGINSQETYSTFQYGLGDHLATGIDLYTGPGNASYWGAILRYGQKISQWFNVGGEIMSSFDLNDSFRYSYLTTGLYMNGALSHDGRLFWCTNTWWIANKGADDSWTNYEYVGYTIPLKNGHSITPLVGAIHSWKFDQDIDVAAGFYYTIKNWTMYIWGNDFLKDHLRLVAGLEFIL